MTTLKRAASKLIAPLVNVSEQLVSKFSAWSRAELIDLLISEGVELRGEGRLALSTVRDLCDEYFHGRAMPNKVPKLSLTQLSKFAKHARIVQNIWIESQFRKRMKESKGKHRYSNAESIDFSMESFVSKNPQGSPARAPKQLLPSPASSPVPKSLGTPVTPAGTPGVTPSPTSPQTHTPQAKTFVTSSADTPAEQSQAVMQAKVVSYLDQPWHATDWNKAQEYAAFVQTRRGGKGGKSFSFSHTTGGRHCCQGLLGEQCDLWKEGQISEFGVYGPGVTNYFKFIKWSFWLFAILALISMPALVINVFGPNVQNAGLTELAKTTVGNLEYAFSNTTFVVHIPGCYDYGGYHVTCDLNKFDLGQFYSRIDLIIAIVILCAYAWLKYFEGVEQTTLDKNTFFAGMYTIMVTNLPPNATEQDVTQFLSTLLPTEPGERRRIVDIQVAFDNETEIMKCKERGKLILKKKRLIAEHRYLCTELRKSPGPDTDNAVIKAREEFIKQCKLIDEKIIKKQEVLNVLSDVKAKPLVAFVTYDDVSSAKKILYEFNKLTHYQWRYTNNKFKFQGNCLSLSEAPEPSTILWENLKYRPWQQAGRRAVTTFLSLLLVVFSVAITFGSKYTQLRLTEKQGSDICPAGFTSMTQSDQQQMVTDNHALLHCYCSQMTDVHQARDPYCRMYYKDKAEGEVLIYFSSIVVLLVNTFMEMTMRLFANFEKHHSEDNKGRNVFTRLFFLKYINTSCVFLINNNYPGIVKLFGMPQQPTVEFSAQWYQSIGVTILLVQMGDILMAHSDKLCGFVDWLLRLKRAKTDPMVALTQEELNKLHEGPHFELSYNYSQLMSTFFVCLTFSTGMPVLYGIAAANFFVYYFIDKYLFINYYRAPPRYSVNIGQQANFLIPFAVALHLGMSIWVLSNRDFFSSSAATDSTTSLVVSNTSGYVGLGVVSSKISQQQTFPLFVFLILVLVLRFLLSVLLHFFKSLDKFARGCCGEVLCDSREDPTALDNMISFSRAVQRNLMKGLYSYNILLNPLYKEAFGISWKFAAEHSRVGSVRLDTAKAGSAEVEDDVEMGLVSQYL